MKSYTLKYKSSGDASWIDYTEGGSIKVRQMKAVCLLLLIALINQT